MQTLSTLGEVLSWMARYAGGSVPSVNDAQRAEWIGWINEGQEDAAERGFWTRLLTKASLSITTADTATLPENFHKRNGIYVLKVGDDDWNEANNNASQTLFVNKNTDGDWIVNFRGFTPETATTGELWYFRHPGVLVEDEDILALDGKMCGFYALVEYFRQAGELGSLDDARAEYNNRYSENLENEMLPTPQEIMSWKPYYKFGNQNTDEKSFYTRNRRRRT